jgi:predicted MFS family arabinose efflux permease
VLGIFIAALAPNFQTFMAGRALSGFGYGIGMTSSAALWSMWFQGKRFAAINTYTIVTNCVGVSLAYSITPVLLSLCGSWRAVMWIFSAMSLVYALICLFVATYPPCVGEALKKQRDAVKSGQEEKPKSGLGRPFTFKDYWLLLIASIVYTCVNTAYLTYMAVYLERIGLAVATVALIASSFSISQIFGSLAGGILTAQTGRRKPLIIVATVIYSLAFIFFVIFGQNVIAVILMAILAGMSGFGKMPVLGMYLVEETGAYDPTLVGPASSMVNGIPMLANLVVSAAIGLMVMGPLGYGRSFIILAVVSLISTAALLFLDEVGPHSKKAKAAATKLKGGA